jgi:DNA-binding protein YbaB
MKKLLFSLTALALSNVLFAQKKADDIAKFKTETIDLGKIQQGNPTTASFSVFNIGTEPLIIEQANPTCGCTISDYTKEPIANGKAGEIKATYNAANIGAFEKHLTVKFAGTTEVKSITIKGEVLSKEDFAKLPAATTPVPSEKVTPQVDTKSKAAVKEAPVKATKTKATTKQ